MCVVLLIEHEHTYMKVEREKKKLRILLCYMHILMDVVKQLINRHIYRQQFKSSGCKSENQTDHFSLMRLYKTNSRSYCESAQYIANIAQIDDGEKKKNVSMCINCSAAIFFFFCVLVRVCVAQSLFFITNLIEYGYECT